MAQADAEPITSMIPPLGRRGFLAALGALALPALPAAAMAALPAPASLLDNPTPAMARMGRRLDRLAEAFRVAHARADAVRKRFAELRPAVPDDIVVTRETEFLKHYAEREGAWPTGGSSRLILDGPHLRRGLSEPHLRQYGPRTKVGRLIRRKLEAAEAYEAAVERAREASGMTESCIADEYHAGRQLETVAHDAAEMPAKNMADVAVKVCAFALCRVVSATVSYRAVHLIAVPVMDDIVRLTAEARGVA